MPKKQSDYSNNRYFSPATSPEEKEKQLITLAVDLAEKQLRDGTASSQLITHYLKLATKKEELERQLLEQQVELTSTKNESIKSSKRSEELYEEVIRAMRTYTGQDEFNDTEDVY